MNLVFDPNNIIQWAALAVAILTALDRLGFHMGPWTSVLVYLAKILAGKPAEGLKQLEIAAKLNPNLAGPHFQLFNQYRQAGREEAASELKIFQEIKKRQAGAAVPEDMEWSYYSEIYETIEPKPADRPALPRRSCSLPIASSRTTSTRRRPASLSWISMATAART